MGKDKAGKKTVRDKRALEGLVLSSDTSAELEARGFGRPQASFGPEDLAVFLEDFGADDATTWEDMAAALAVILEARFFPPEQAAFAAGWMAEETMTPEDKTAAAAGRPNRAARRRVRRKGW